MDNWRMKEKKNKSGQFMNKKWRNCKDTGKLNEKMENLENEQKRGKIMYNWGNNEKEEMNQQ